MMGDNKMIERYIIQDICADSWVLAIKYNIIQEELTIGGYSRYRPHIENIIKDYFRLSVDFIAFKMTQKNKMRYVFPFQKVKLDKALDKIREHGFSVEQVRNLERIMR